MPPTRGNGLDVFGGEETNGTTWRTDYMNEMLSLTSGAKNQPYRHARPLVGLMSPFMSSRTKCLS